MIEPQKPAEVRQATLIFYTKLIQGQYRDLSIMRSRFFRVIKSNELASDLPFYLDLLMALTDRGKDIQNFEEEIGSFMLRWMDQIIAGKLTAEYLEVIVNIIKFNTAYIDRENVIGIVQRLCNDVCFQFVNDRETFLQCLRVIETVICYTVFPNEILAPCIIVLCRAVNNEAYLETSHKTMKNLLGTKLQYASLLTMTSMLTEPRYYVDAQVLRGAVFHINMNLWGGPNNSTQNGFKYSSTVLWSYLKALDSEHIIVAFEIIISIQTLMGKCGRELSEPSWDLILEILESILSKFNISFLYKSFIKLYVSEREKMLENPDLLKRFHDVIDFIEVLVKENAINADIEKIYGLIEKTSSKRSVRNLRHLSLRNKSLNELLLLQESSVIGLISFKVSKISPIETGWLKQLTSLMERFYRQEPNQNIRLAMIDYAREIVNTYRVCYEDEILEKVVIVIFSDIAQEHDVKIRVSVCKLLLEICSRCDTKRCIELLDVLEKVLNHPFDLYSLDSSAPRNEYDFEDSFTVVNGLIELFLEKLYQLPSSHVLKIYFTLIGHLESHYQHPKVFENAVKIRFTIINWMLKIRANAAFHVGYPSPRLISDHFKFTHYLAIEGDHHPPQTPGIQENLSNEEKSFEDRSNFCVATLSLKRSWDTLVKCLLVEKDWPTVQLILRELPKMMQNKTLIQGNDVNTLANTLVELFKGNYTKEMFFERFTTSNEQKDFRALMIPAVASLITYNSFFNVPTKKKIVAVLESEVRIDGNLSICVQAFTTLLFEKCEIFERQLAEIILKITKVSDTVQVALPILEFLSTIAHLPYSFVNLSQKQFSYVFATCLPYTSPARYDHYIVSLAHHIIASWFLKSRIQWRRGYADYIIEGIAKNIDKSLKDAQIQQKQALQEKGFLVNEDSSLRQRSSSLTEQSSRRREINNQQVMKMKHKVSNPQSGNKDFDMHSFHIELIQTCIDFMERNSFSLSSALPKRIPAADFLLRGGGQTKTWVVGNNVVTITTNACMDNHDSKSCACFCSDWAEITIRKPSSMVSWLMKFENQVGLFANDFSFHDLTSLFSDREVDAGNPNGILVRKKNEGSNISLVDELPLERSLEKLSVREEESYTKIPLQSTSSDSAVFSYQTKPIDIPAKPEPESVPIEDDDEDVSCNDEDSDDTKRNPVRRVNSSPEMRSNWKQNMSSKSSKESKSGSSSKDTTISDDHEDTVKVAEVEVQQKKKMSYSKETKVSCEAIPEEIITAGNKEDSLTEKTNMRPVQLLSSISAQETVNVTNIPKKQHSADDTFQLRRTESNASPAMQPISKNQNWANSSTSNLPLSPRYGYKHSVTRQVSHQTPLESEDTGIRARSKTISVIGNNKEAYINPGTNSDFSVSTSSFEQPQSTTLATSGINPSFVFVQLFSNGKINSPEIFPVAEKHQTSLNLLDLIPPYEIHKIGVLYVGPGQANNESEILRNRHGSLRYTQFLHNLGSLIAIKDAKEKKLFVNMEAQREGNFTYVWHDEIIQMTFHVATLM